MNTRKVLTSKLSIAVLAVIIAAGSAQALPCGIVSPCPTNFAIAPALKAPVRVVASGGGSVWALDTNYVIYHFNAFYRRRGQWNLGLNAGQAYRYVPSTRTWVLVYGAQLNTISSGTGGGVWGVNATTGVVYSFF